MAKRLFILSVLAIFGQTLSAQYTYTIKADSVKITNCDSSELIIENHTQGVKGFLYNTGNGRTIFKKGVVKVNDSLYLIGSDSLKYNAWVQGGNKFGATGILGTIDNNHLDFYSAGAQQMRLTNTGKLLIGSTTDNGINNLQVNGSVYGNYFTNTPVQLGGFNPSGAIRLRWGTGDGTYIGFYFQGKTTRRGIIASAADNRTLQIDDSIGVAFIAPTVAIGAE